MEPKPDFLDNKTVSKNYNNNKKNFVLYDSSYQYRLNVKTDGVNGPPCITHRHKSNNYEVCLYVPPIIRLIVTYCVKRYIYIYK